MTEQVENIILEHIRVMRGDIALIKQDLRDVTLRLGSLEIHVGAFVAQLAHVPRDQNIQTSPAVIVT